MQGQSSLRSLRGVLSFMALQQRQRRVYKGSCLFFSPNLLNTPSHLQQYRNWNSSLFQYIIRNCQYAYFSQFLWKNDSLQLIGGPTISLNTTGLYLQSNLQISMSSTLTLEEIRNLEAPTEDFLCKPEDNIYGIEFVYFKIRNAINNQVLFQIRKPESQIGKKAAEPIRFVQYQFGPHFFKLSTIGTTLQFKVGEKPVKKFLMIEKHYFKGKLIKSFQFQVPFCMPGSQNSLEAVYELPQFGPELEEDMIKSPFETVSDSFYFVEGKLVMHNKAAYSYAPFD